MSHQDSNVHTGATPQHQALKQALDWLVSWATPSDVTFRQDCTWSPRGLILTALLWAWSDETALRDRFAAARKIVVRMLRPAQQPATSYQAFLKMLRTWTVALTPALVTAFRHRMREDLADRLLVQGYPGFLTTQTMGSPNDGAGMTCDRYPTNSLSDSVLAQVLFLFRLMPIPRGVVR